MKLDPSAMLRGGRSRTNPARRTRSADEIGRDTERARASRRRALVTGLLLAPPGAAGLLYVLSRHPTPLFRDFDPWLDYAATRGSPDVYVFGGAVVLLALGLLNLVTAALHSVSIMLNDGALAARRLQVR